jgi:hypothetical protein
MRSSVVAPALSLSLGCLACLAFGAFGAFGVACSSSSAEPLESGVLPSCAPFDAGPADDGGLTGEGGAPVLRAQVDTIVNFSCAISSCHGRSPGQGHLFLPKRQAADAGAGMNGDWYDQVVGVASQTNPSMQLVKPGDPAASWLVHKVGGDQCYFKDACAMGNCGDRMPQANLALDPADVATIVAWVREGAPR